MSTLSLKRENGPAPTNRIPNTPQDRSPTVPFCHQEPVTLLVDHLHQRFSAGESLSVTWVNHYSVIRALDHRNAALNTFDFIGVDGKLLQHILSGRYRTSADLVIPALLPKLVGARVALIGGCPETALDRAQAIQGILPADATIVLNLDGYGRLPTLADFAEKLAASRANVAIIGLGAGLQEAYAACAKEAFIDHGLAITCGGFMDQLLVSDYYPKWAYPLRLNWLVRLAREPRRLWRRYSVDAIIALKESRALRQRTSVLGGLWV